MLNPIEIVSDETKLCQAKAVGCRTLSGSKEIQLQLNAERRKMQLGLKKQ